MASLKNTIINDTGFLRLPSGTIAQRPASPSAGMFRYNTDLRVQEYYNGTRWMTTTGRNAIVQNGLLLWLDAGITSSYPGSGTTWTDLSGNGNHGTLTNGPGYDSRNLGGITFDNTNDIVVINSTALGRIGNSNHTITAWINNASNNSDDFIGTGGNAIGDVLLMLYSVAGGGQGGFRGHVWSSAGSPNTIDSPRAIGTNSWSMLTQRVTWGGNIELIENGVVTASQALSGSAATSSQTQFLIGCRVNPPDSGSAFNGRIAVVQVYNRALTNAELAQNFNALRYRFGV